MAYKPMAGAPLLGGGDEEDPLGAPGPSAASVSTPGAMGQSARGPFSHAGTSPGPPVLTPTPHESLAAAGEAMVDTDLAHVVLDSSDALLASWRTSATSGVESLHVTRRRVVLQCAHSRLGGLYSERKTTYARLEDVGTIEVTSRPLRWDNVMISAFVIGIITFIVTYVADTDDSPHDKFSGNDRWDALANTTVLAAVAAVLCLAVQRVLAARANPVLSIRARDGGAPLVFALGTGAYVGAAKIEERIRRTQAAARGEAASLF